MREHWLETAHGRIVAGDDELDVLADYGWVQLTDEEQEAVKWCRDNIIPMSSSASAFAFIHTAILRKLLERLNHDAVPEAKAAEPESSVPPGSVAAPANTHTLTDEEREAVEWYAGYGRDGLHADTLRKLLERMG
jgi:hypothetical protein